MAEKKFFVSEGELQESYSELQSTLKVAAKYSVSKKLILNYLKKYGINRPPNCADETVKRIVELASGNKAFDIATKLNLSLCIVNKHIRKHNIKIQRYHKGFTKTSNGYILVFNPDHPNARKHGYVSQHVLLMSEKIGRALNDNEVVHHIDGNKSNNNMDNLELMAKFDHKSFHSKQPRKRKSLVTNLDDIV
jgi:hypothetical protein